MKHSPDPLDPDELDGAASVHDQIVSGEKALLAALGRPDADQAPLTAPLGGADETGSPRPDFRDRLRAQFLGADPVADAKLAAWAPEGARPDFRDRLKGAFLDAAACDQTSVGAEAQRTGTRRTGIKKPSSIERRSPRPVRSRSNSPRTPVPARTNRFRLAAAAGLLAAAAAVILFLRGSAPDAAAWTLDLGLGNASEQLAAIRIDGEAVATQEEFQARMGTAKRLQSLDQEIRIRHGEEFVMELEPGSAIALDAWVAQPAEGESQVLRLERGGVRVATGPAFDKASSLIVETTQVRAEVLGTVFGVDVWADHSCVCCYQGTVRTTPLGCTPDQRLESLSIGPNRSRVLAGLDSLEDLLPHEAPLQAGHRGPLERLSKYWG